MDTTDQTPAPQPTPQPAASAAPQYPPPYQPGYAPPKKKMSTGAKWAIGIAIAVLLLLCGSCALGAALLGGDTSTLATGDSIAEIHIDGTIQGGGASYSNGSPEYILSQIEGAVDDDSVKAILLRIDSPGGTVAASQEIMLAVRRANEKKPVVTSVGDVCASGAYMVASQSTEIVALPGSSVGSIGVIMEVANVEELLNKVGISFTTLHEGEYKDAGSMYRSLTETETAMLNEQLAVVYDEFIADVAKGRKMDEAEVRKLATGWVWLGSEAIDLGLIDSIGNYDDAVKRAGELGGIKGKPNIVTFEYSDPITSFLSSLIGVFSPRDALDTETLERISLPR